MGCFKKHQFRVHFGFLADLLADGNYEKFSAEVIPGPSLSTLV